MHLACYWWYHRSKYFVPDLVSGVLISCVGRFQMPITPEFRLSQTREHVIAVIRLPYIKVTNLEYLIEGHDFSLYCYPYLLKLTLPGEVVDEEESGKEEAQLEGSESEGGSLDSSKLYTRANRGSRTARAQYDPNKDNGTLTVYIPKKTPGEDFPDLDMVTKLMQPKPRFPGTGAAGSSQPKIPTQPGEDKEESARKQLEEMYVSQQQQWDRYQRSKQNGPPLIEVLDSTEFEENNENAEDVASWEPSSGSTSATGSSLVTSQLASSHSGEAGSTSCSQTAAVSAPVRSSSELLDSPEENEIKFPSGNNGISYGFNDQYQGVFRPFGEESVLIVDLPSPETTPVEHRSNLRERSEMELFDIERYMLDFLYGNEDNIYQSAVEYIPWWVALENESRSVGDKRHFTEQENRTLRGLPNKEYLIGDNERPKLFAGLVSLVYAYCYDYRTTEGEHSSESGWTLCKLSPLLSWLDTLPSPSESLKACVRRALIFPYIRRFDLATLVATDVVTVFKLGKRAILRCLLAVKQLLEKEDHVYLLNTLYIDDYCVWIQHLAESTICDVYCDLYNALESLRKESLCLGLRASEENAVRVRNDEISPEEAIANVKETLCKYEAAECASSEDDDSSMASSTTGTTEEETEKSGESPAQQRLPDNAFTEVTESPPRGQ
eukprot:gb/GECG01006592.1/.p1 GENE.gb/GECG01006592.1/~~gb/GECG01006592.1/.p1  ORF type:complete len:665 (+),score=92.63 gb/GECG01006592.1/:1-1995(+)